MIGADAQMYHLLYRFCAAAIVACAVLVCGACGGGSSPSMSPSPSADGSGGSGGASGGTTITITSNGVSPKSLAVPAGTQVTFVNNDKDNHDMASDPHPVHTDCPDINAVGFLSPGQSRQTNPLRTVRTCGYHDHNQPSNTALQGTIVIQ
jgi:plastocyanin